MSVLWTPKLLLQDLWLDSSDQDTITLDGSGNLEQWRDKSPHGRHYSQANAAARPGYIPNHQNGLPAVDMSQKQTWLDCTPWAQGQEADIYVVSDNTALQTSWRIFMQRSGGLAPYISTSGANYRPSFWWGAAQAVNSRTINRPALIRWSYHAGGNPTGLTQVDGDETTIATSATALSISNSWVSIGVNPSIDVTQWAAIRPCEIIILPRRADTATRRKIEGYLTHKWGLTAHLPADHIYKTTPPMIEEGSKILGGEVSDIEIGGAFYRVHAVKTSQNIEVLEPVNAEVLLVGGGGGGAGLIAGGGGGGGVLDEAITLTPGTYSVVIGTGGVGGTGWNTYDQYGRKGGDTTFAGLTAFGGGGARKYGGYTSIEFPDGGSGGGATGGSIPGGTGVVGQGHAGGTNIFGHLPYAPSGPSGYNHGAGGGGAGGPGGDTDTLKGGDSGPGLDVSGKYGDDVGFNGYVGAGGAGGVRSGESRVAGTHLHGGGFATTSTVRAGDGYPNSGAGGGGAGFHTTSSSQIGGNGADGILVLRYPLAWAVANSTHTQTASHIPKLLTEIHSADTSHAVTSTTPTFLFRPNSARQKHRQRWHLIRLDFVYREREPATPSVTNGGALRFDYNPKLPREIRGIGFESHTFSSEGEIRNLARALYLTGRDSFWVGPSTFVSDGPAYLNMTFRSAAYIPPVPPLELEFKEGNPEVVVHLAFQSQYVEQCNVGVRIPLFIQHTVQEQVADHTRVILPVNAASTQHAQTVDQVRVALPVRADGAKQEQTATQPALIHTSPLRNLDASHTHTAIQIRIRHTIPLTNIDNTIAAHFAENTYVIHRPPARAHSTSHWHTSDNIVVTHISPLLINKGTQEVAAPHITIRNWSRVVSASARQEQSVEHLILYIFAVLVPRNTRHLMRSMRLNFLPADWVFRAILDIEPETRLLAIDYEDRSLEIEYESRVIEIESETRELTIPAEDRTIELEPEGRAAPVER